VNSAGLLAVCGVKKLCQSRKAERDDGDVDREGDAGADHDPLPVQGEAARGTAGRRMVNATTRLNRCFRCCFHESVLVP
jgi:hypothetical protein